MREIKFRAWDKQQFKMYQWEAYAFSRHGIWLTWTTVVSEPDMYELLQYTGLKDKNGKEIYEGDILESRAVIEWFVDGFSKRVETPKGTRYFSLFRNEEEHELSLRSTVIATFTRPPT